MEGASFLPVRAQVVGIASLLLFGAGAVLGFVFQINGQKIDGILLASFCCTGILSVGMMRSWLARALARNDQLEKRLDARLDAQRPRH